MTAIQRDKSDAFTHYHALWAKRAARKENLTD